MNVKNTLVRSTFAALALAVTLLWQPFAQARSVQRSSVPFRGAASRLPVYDGTLNTTHWYPLFLYQGEQAVVHGVTTVPYNGYYLGVNLYVYRWDGQTWGAPIQAVRSGTVFTSPSTGYFALVATNPYAVPLDYSVALDPHPGLIPSGSTSTSGGSLDLGGRNTFAAGEEVRVSYNLPAANGAAGWVGLFHQGAVTWRNRIDYRYLNGVASGTWTFQARGKGDYEVRFYTDDSDAGEVKSATVRFSVR